ncbi:MAG: DUF4124 domain-containing protein, partial [Cycloclasticus pugetii]
MGCVNHFILLILLLVAIPVIQADLYKKVDKNGHVYFTDNPVGGGFKLIMRTHKKGTIEYKNFPLDIAAFNASKIAHCK